MARRQCHQRVLDGVARRGQTGTASPSGPAFLIGKRIINEYKPVLNQSPQIPE